jgi:hypothetical protein
VNDDNIRHTATCILANLSCAQEGQEGQGLGMEQAGQGAQGAQGQGSLEEVLVQYGMLGVLQSLMSHLPSGSLTVHTHNGSGIVMSHQHLPRADSMCYLLLALSNISEAITGESCEQVVRMLFTLTQKLDILKQRSKALFVAEVFINYSRLACYSQLLVDEGLLQLLLMLMDSHKDDAVLRPCCEILGIKPTYSILK